MLVHCKDIPIWKQFQTEKQVPGAKRLLQVCLSAVNANLYPMMLIKPSQIAVVRLADRPNEFKPILTLLL